MKNNFKQFNSIKTSNIITLNKEFKEAINKARNKSYAESLFVEKTNTAYRIMQNEFTSFSRFLTEIEEKKELDINFYADKEFDKFNSNDIQTIAIIAATKSFLTAYYKSKDNKKEIRDGKSEIQWKGESQIEFILLIMSLYESKMISNSDDKINKLINQVAEVLNFDLRSNWRSLLSETLKERVEDYKPTIIEKIESGFDILRNKSILRRKLKRSKKN
jgi:hypothetical protein